MANSKIEWTDATWNTVSGCTKISAGCKNCYAETMTRRLKGFGQEKYEKGFDEVCVHPETLDEPLTWKKPRMVFVNSMSDLFHADVPEDFILKVFNVMVKASDHIFQVLTKRSDRLLQLSPKLPWQPNIWAGVTVEDSENLVRADHLRRTAAGVKFISFEPLLGPMKPLNLKGIDWAIVGGESGPKARPMEEEWVLLIRDKCQGTKTPFFFKQWGGKNKKKAGRLLEGRTWDEMPEVSNNLLLFKKEDEK